MIILLHLINQDNEVVYSNLKPEHLFSINFQKEFTQRSYCRVEKRMKRHGLRIFEGGKLYLALFNDDVTGSDFNKYTHVVMSIFSSFGKLKDENVKGQTHKFRRLKHNLVNHNANILQEIYKLVPQEDLVKGGRNQAKVIEKILNSKTKDSSYSLLRILKSANLMKAEFDVYDMLNNDQPFLDFQKHFIHKVVVLTLNPFWLDLIEKGITISISKCEAMVEIDYKSLSVALCHLFDNATKYTLPDSNFNIVFETEEYHVKISFEMTSLKIEDEELKNICEENYSGHWARALGLSGDGIGMNVITKIIEINEGTLHIEKNTNPKLAQKINGIPYETNKFWIRLNRSF